MNTATIHTPSIIASLHGWFRWLLPPTVPSRQLPQAYTLVRPSGLSATPVLRNNRFKLQSPRARAANPIRKPLRIVRVVEDGHSAAQVGRMVISGRMADVCAELDRMSAREATRH